MLDKAQIKKIDEIIVSLVVRNMAAGANFKKAKIQAFNRFNKERPGILAAWINARR